MITKDGRDTAIEKLTAENYLVPKGEEKDYHCVIEVVQYDPKTGRKISKPRVQKFGRKTFENTVLASLRKQGYEVRILHDPNKWLEENQKAAAEKAKAEAEAQKKAEEEKFQAAVQAAVAKELAKMQAEVAEAKAAAEKVKAAAEKAHAAAEKAKAEAAKAAAEKPADREKSSGDTGEAPETSQKHAKKGDK